jgi:hypothetical protein
MKVDANGYGEIARGPRGRHRRPPRRPGSPLAGKPVCDAGAACDDEYGAAVFSSQEVN